MFDLTQPVSIGAAFASGGGAGIGAVGGVVGVVGAGSVISGATVIVGAAGRMTCGGGVVGGSNVVGGRTTRLVGTAAVFEVDTIGGSGGSDVGEPSESSLPHATPSMTIGITAIRRILILTRSPCLRQSSPERRVDHLPVVAVKAPARAGVVLGTVASRIHL